MAPTALDTTNTGKGQVHLSSQDCISLEERYGAHKSVFFIPDALDRLGKAPVAIAEPALLCCRSAARKQLSADPSSLAGSSSKRVRRSTLTQPTSTATTLCPLSSRRPSELTSGTLRCVDLSPSAERVTGFGSISLTLLAMHEHRETSTSTALVLTRLSTRVSCSTAKENELLAMPKGAELVDRDTRADSYYHHRSLPPSHHQCAHHSGSEAHSFVARFPHLLPRTFLQDAHRDDWIRDGSFDEHWS